MDKNNLAIPIAIVLAGALIAGGVYFGGKKEAPATGQKPLPTSIALRQVDETDHILGNPDAALTIVEYSDLQCPFCQQMHKTFEEIMKSYGKDGKVAWVYRHFPLRQIHPFAEKASQGGECVASLGGNDKFWAYINYIFENDQTQSDRVSKPSDAAVKAGVDVNAFNQCLTSSQFASKVEAQYQEAIKAGGRGTPFNIFIPKKALKKDVVQKIVDMFSSYPAGQSPLIYADTKTIAISASMQYADMAEIIDLMIK